MNARLPSLLSVLLHFGLLALLSLVTFRAREIVTPPVGMAIEIVDLDHAMPLPDPAFVRHEDVEVATPAAATAPAAARQAAPAPMPLDTAVPAAPLPPVEASPAPSQPAESLQPSQRPAPVLGPGPVARPLPAAPTPTRPPASAPTPPAAASPSAAVPQPVAPVRRLDGASLARTLGKPIGSAPRPRLNSGAIGSAIGQAVPRGVAGLTIRQRANLVDMIRSQITPCWNPPQAEEGSGHVTVLMRIRLGRDGQVSGSPTVARISGQTVANGAYANALAGSVRRAVLRCAPLRLPAELYDAWADVELNFDPRDIS